MIIFSTNNRSQYVSTILSQWLQKSDEDSYARNLWREYFGVTGNDYADWYDDDWDNYGDGDYGHYSPEENKSPFSKPSVSECDILDDDALWTALAEKYDTPEKSNSAIQDFLQHGAPISTSEKSKSHENSILDDEEKLIIFYEDPLNEHLTQKFTSVDTFLAFCTDNGIYVDSLVNSDLEYYPQCHCALDAYESTNGVKELRCSKSYGALIYDLFGESIFDSASDNKDNLPF